MINIKSKTCEFEDCEIQSTFNFEGEVKKRFCLIHKLEGMINIKDKTCEFKDCKIQPCFNFKEEKKTRFCSNHKLDGMLDKKNKICEYKNCKIQSTFNFEGEIKRRFCVNHKLERMINIKNETCKTYLCGIQIGDKYDGYCLRCFIHLFPDKPVSRNYKTKEFAVIEYIKLLYPNLSWNSDKIIKDGCSKKRPDILLDLGYQIIIIEIDENQHKNYGDCSCENKRLLLLSQDLGHRPIIFIRFNPDDYLNEKGEKIKSCWKITKKTGICIINNKKEWTTRLESLQNQIDYWINPKNQTDKIIEVIQLFYDNYI